MATRAGYITIRPEHLVGMTDIAEQFGVKLNTVWTWTSKPGFPEPLAHPGKRPVWDLCKVVEWEKQWVRSKGGFHTHRSRAESSDTHQRKPSRRSKH